MKKTSEEELEEEEEEDGEELEEEGEELEEGDERAREEGLEGGGVAGGQAGHRQLSGLVGVGRAEQLKCTQPPQWVHWIEYSLRR